MSLSAGTRLGPYEILAPLGSLSGVQRDIRAAPGRRHQGAQCLSRLVGSVCKGCFPVRGFSGEPFGNSECQAGVLRAQWGGHDGGAHCCVGAAAQNRRLPWRRPLQRQSCARGRHPQFRAAGGSALLKLAPVERSLQPALIERPSIPLLRDPYIAGYFAQTEEEPVLRDGRPKDRKPIFALRSSARIVTVIYGKGLSRRVLGGGI